jgi:hypothetical protein
MRTAATLALWFVLTPVALLWGEIPCPCDAAQPATLAERQCGLCAQAEREPAGTSIFFVKDNSPRKPNRWLALPRQHSPGMHTMSALPPDVRVELWRNAIAKAKELWGEQWGIAYNAERLHTQCHVHIHIGKLIDGVEAGEFTIVSGPEEIPLPGNDGLWVHPVNGKLHVHLGEQVTENVLLR